MNLFSEAEAIIDPHGGGLTNMICALDCSLVTEISTEPKIQYIMMGKQLGHLFTRLWAKEGNHSNDMKLSTQVIPS